jgi:hypothetical protein
MAPINTVNTMFWVLIGEIVLYLPYYKRLNNFSQMLESVSQGTILVTILAPRLRLGRTVGPSCWQTESPYWFVMIFICLPWVMR